MLYAGRWGNLQALYCLVRLVVVAKEKSGGFNDMLYKVFFLSPLDQQ